MLSDDHIDGIQSLIVMIVYKYIVMYFNYIKTIISVK